MAAERTVRQSARRRTVALAELREAASIGPAAARRGGLITGRAAPPLVTAMKRRARHRASESEAAGSRTDRAVSDRTDRQAAWQADRGGGAMSSGRRQRCRRP